MHSLFVSLRLVEVTVGSSLEWKSVSSAYNQKNTLILVVIAQYFSERACMDLRWSQMAVINFPSQKSCLPPSRLNELKTFDCSISLLVCNSESARKYAWYHQFLKSEYHAWSTSFLPLSQPCFSLPFRSAPVPACSVGFEKLIPHAQVCNRNVDAAYHPPDHYMG